MFDCLDQNRKCYVPRMRSKEELLNQVKFKKSWKGSGNQNTYFMEPPIMKPKILDPWTMTRVQQPERAYEKFFASKYSTLLLCTWQAHLKSDENLLLT